MSQRKSSFGIVLFVVLLVFTFAFANVVGLALLNMIGSVKALQSDALTITATNTGSGTTYSANTAKAVGIWSGPFRSYWWVPTTCWFLFWVLIVVVLGRSKPGSKTAEPVGAEQPSA